MDIKRNIKQAMHELGYSKPRKHQIIPIRALTDGKDAIVHAPTGSGKTAIFATAGQVYKHQLTVVVEPLLALIYNQVQALQQQGIAADYLDHTRSKQDTDHILAKACSGKLTFLYVTPERLQSKAFIHAMQQADLYMLVVDECHCITEWGYTFRDAYLHIGDFIDKLPHKPVICACSATLQDAQLGQITKALRMKDPVICRCNLERSNLILLKKDVSSKHKSLEKRLAYRVQSLQKCIRKYWTGGAVVVFAMTTNYVDALYNALEEIYPEQVARYHAQDFLNLSQLCVLQCCRTCTDNRLMWKPVNKIPDLQIRVPEGVAPFGDAVAFIHNEHVQISLLHGMDKRFVLQAFWRYIEEGQLSAACFGQDVIRILFGSGVIQIIRRDSLQV